MRLDGIHHVTCITGDAPRNVDFYTRVLGLRLVKKTVNQDDPTVYHLFYADEDGTPGSDITFFEYPGVRRGRAGAGMVHTVQWRVGSEAALDFWESRLASATRRRERRRARVRDPEGLRHRARRVVGRGRAARRGAPGGPRRARAAGLRRRPRIRRRRLTRAARCSRRRSGSMSAGEDAGRRAARRAAASTRTTSRRPSAGSAAPARSITSPGRRRSRSTRRGTSG